MAYLSSVPDATTADGSTPWFKIYQNAWSPTNSGVGDNDNWGVKDLNACCGRLDVPIPESLPSGDYLLRAEVVALHALPAQLYISCYQLTIEGTGGASLPAGVSFPGAYSSSDPGLSANIHAQLSSYTAPGPKVVAGGTEIVPGGGCSGGCEETCVPESGPSSTLEVSEPTGGAGGGGGGGCQVDKYGQCGGTGYTGCTTCAVSVVIFPWIYRELTNCSRPGLRVTPRISTTISVSRAGVGREERGAWAWSRVYDSKTLKDQLVSSFRFHQAC